MKYEKGCATVTELFRSARKICITMYITTKEGYTASILGVSAAFYGPVARRAIHVLLNLHLIPHPHTGDAIVDFLQRSLAQWQIDPQKILFFVTDNGSNKVKAVRILSGAFQSNMS